MKSRSLILYFLLSLIVNTNFSQVIKYTPPITKEIIVNYGDSMAIIHVLTNKKEMITNDDIMYFWYYANIINQNIGGFQGNLLHGNFSLLKDNHLVTLGYFNNGIKVKCWKYWYKNGNIKEIQYWKEGKKEGRNLIFDKYGNLVLESNYKNGLLHGTYKKISQDKITTIRKFRNGKEILKNIKRADEPEKAISVKNRETKDKITKEKTSKGNISSLVKKNIWNFKNNKEDKDKSEDSNKKGLKEKKVKNPEIHNGLKQSNKQINGDK